MKKIVLGLMVLAFAGAGIHTARAGSGWCIAGGVLAGLTAGLVVGQALAPHPVYYAAPARVYYPAPGYSHAYSYAPAPQPTIVYSAPGPAVYATPGPVVVYRRPGWVARPAVNIVFGYYHGCRPYYYRPGCW